MQSRLEAERRAARAELANVYRADWWDQATPEQIGHAYQAARAWAQEGPEAVRAEQRIRDELRTRYGIDADNAGAAPADVQVAIERADRDRVRADVERTREQAERAEAHRLLRCADHEERVADDARAAAQHEPNPDERLRAAADAEQREASANHLQADSGAFYDSAERRQATSHELEAKGIDRKVLATKIRADVSQAQPATEAVRATSRTAKARKTRARGPQRQRTNLDR